MDLRYEHHDKIQQLAEDIVAHYGVAVDPLYIRVIHDSTYHAYGWWNGEKSEIGVNFAICESWEDVVGTLIHEYWHYFQEEEADFVAERDLHLFLGEETGS